MIARKILRFFIYSLAFTGLPSCIKNDIPYPYLEGNIEEIEVYDMVEEPKIDQQGRIIELVVGENANLKNLKITKLVVNNDATIIPDSAACLSFNQFPNFSFSSLNELPANANTAVDFSNPVEFLIKTYQNYVWTVQVKQQIDRYIHIEHQVGEAVFDIKTHTAIVYVEKGYSLKDIHITGINLEGKSAEIIPDPYEITDFTRPREFRIFKGEEYLGMWTVDVQPTEQASSIGSVDAWATKATLTGGMRSGATPVVQYKKSTESEWMEASDITLTSSTSFKAELTGLSDGTVYEWRIVVDGTVGSSSTFETEKIAVIPNLNFDTWVQDDKKKNWYANSVADNYDASNAYWATGNEGVTSTLAGGNECITEPVEGSDAYKGKAAKMHSLTGITLVGAAAGNLFIGKYKTNMSKPASSVEFGRPFTGARPTKLRGYYKYTPMPITNGGTKPGNLTTDQCHVYLKLWDEKGREIAYGEFVGSDKVDTYTQFEFDIDYTDKTAKPAMITIVATSSKYGGEFEGAKVVGQVGEGSTLWVDEFELLYD